MTSIRKLQLIGLLLLFLGISVQSGLTGCRENCVVSEKGIESCDCSGIVGDSKIRIKRRVICQAGCFASGGKCQCNTGTYGLL